MEFKEFKNKHPESKIIVCGLGESTTLLTDDHRSKVVTMGVNDIGRLFTPNYLVVVNDKVSFREDRWKWIGGSTCPTIFTHIKGLAVPEQAKSIIALGKYGGTDLDKYPIDYTSNSPYIACIIAYHLGAKKIGLLGVDFTPNHFFANTGDHPLSKKAVTISDEYIRLHKALSAKGVEFYNLSPNSKINVPKMHIDDFINL